MVRAVFDGKVTKVDRTHLDATTAPRGRHLPARDERRARARRSGRRGLLLHPRDPRARHCGGQLALVARGDDIGEVIEVSGIAPHLHFAIAERRAGTNFGIDIFEHLIATANTTGATRLTFFADGRPPEIGVPPSTQITTGAALADAVEAEGWDVGAALLAQIRALP